MSIQADKASISLATLIKLSYKTVSECFKKVLANLETAHGVWLKL